MLSTPSFVAERTPRLLSLSEHGVPAALAFPLGPEPNAFEVTVCVASGRPKAGVLQAACSVRRSGRASSAFLTAQDDGKTVLNGQAVRLEPARIRRTALRAAPAAEQYGALDVKDCIRTGRAI